ncbi:MAG: TerD family protein [Streptococcus salivarius]
MNYNVQNVVRFNLTEDGGNATAVKFVELNRTDNGWTFKAVGDYFKASIGEL